MSDELERLLDDPELDSGLRGGLAAFKAEAVDYDLAAGAARFEASLGGPAATTTAAAVTSKTALWVVVAVVVAAAAVAAWALSGESQDVPDPATYAARPPAAQDPDPREESVVEAPTPAPPQEHQAPANQPDPEPALAPTPDDDTGRGQGQAPPTKTRTPAEPKTKPTAKPQNPDTLRAEMRATHAAKTKLAADPAEALRLARAASKAYPDGVFAPEREGIIVLALFATGADGEAKRRAKSYLRQHPRGAHAERIRAALEK